MLDGSYILPSLLRPRNSRPHKAEFARIGPPEISTFLTFPQVYIPTVFAGGESAHICFCILRKGIKNGKDRKEHLGEIIVSDTKDKTAIEPIS